MTAQIITLRPELMPLKGKTLDRPDIQYLSLRTTLDECDAAEKGVEDDLEMAAWSIEQWQKKRIELFTKRSNIRAKRNDTERELQTLLDKYPDVGEKNV